jgi:hypothetical protein
MSIYTKSTKFMCYRHLFYHIKNTGKLGKYEYLLNAIQKMKKIKNKTEGAPPSKNIYKL